MKVPRQAAAKLIKAQPIAEGYQEKIELIELNAIHKVQGEGVKIGAEGGWHDPCRVLPHII
jgi:hypothetical protein